MKFFCLLSLSLILIPFSLSAQLGKGYWIGSINGNYSTTHNNDVWGIVLSPQLLETVAPNFAVGLLVDYGFLKSKHPSGNGYVEKGYVSHFVKAGPSARKYFGKGTLMPYFGLTTGLQFSKIHEIDSGSSDSDVTEYNFFAMPSAGLAYWLTGSVAISLGTSYTIRIGDTSEFDGIQIGLSFLIPRPVNP